MAEPTLVNGQITDTLSQAILGQQASAVGAMTELQVLAIQQATAHAGAMNQLRELMMAALVRELDNK